MINNKQQTAVEFIHEELRKYVRYDNRSAVETFDRIFEQAKEKYQDEMESSIIEICAEKSTSDASKYAEGYSQGFEAALKFVKWKIDNELRYKHNEQR
jgi:flagellar biosynthesis/type III secretory pathway protein FliH